MKARDSYQRGSIVRIHRKTRPDYWALRYYEYNLLGERTQRAAQIGTLEAFPTRAAAERQADVMRSKFAAYASCVYFSDLVARYKQEDMPQRCSTQSSYRSNLRRLEERWGAVRLDWLCSHPLEVEHWLKDLKAQNGAELSLKSKRNLKASLHRLFECAMGWGFIEMQRNPIHFVQLRGLPRRKKLRYVVTPEDYGRIVQDADLALHVRVMVHIAATTGLRISEILGLQWGNICVGERRIEVVRSVVGRHEDATKTEWSESTVMIPDYLAEILEAWREGSHHVGEWVFGNEITKRPFHRDSLQKDHLKPAGLRACVLAFPTSAGIRSGTDTAPCSRSSALRWRCRKR